MENKRAEKIVKHFFRGHYISIFFAFILIIFWCIYMCNLILHSYQGADLWNWIRTLFGTGKGGKVPDGLIGSVFVIIAMLCFYAKTIELFFVAQKDLKKNLISSREIIVTGIFRAHDHNALFFSWSNCRIHHDNLESFLHYDGKTRSFDRFKLGKTYKIEYLTNSKIIIDAKEISKYSTVEKETSDLNEILVWEKKVFEDVCDYILKNKRLFEDDIFEDNNLSCSVFLYSMHSLPNDDYTSNIWICPTKDGLVPIEVHSRKAPVVLFSLIFEIVTPKKIRQKNTVFQLKNDYIEQLESKLSTYISVFFTQQLEPLENQKGYNKDFKLKKQIF